MRSEAIEQRRVVAAAVGRNHWMSWVGDRLHKRLRAYNRNSTFGLAWLLRYGGGASPAEVNGLFMLAMFGVYVLLISRFIAKPTQPGELPGASWFFFVFATLLPAAMAGAMLMQRRPRIANELLLPITRQQLVKGLIQVSLYNSLIVWLIMNVGVVVFLLSSGFELTWQLVAIYLLLSEATMLVGAGISLRVAMYPSRVVQFLVTWLSGMVLALPILSWWFRRDETGDAPFVLLSVVLFAIAAVLIRWARNVWLETELG